MHWDYRSRTVDGKKGYPGNVKNPLIKAYIAWAMVCFFWGTTYLAIRGGGATFPPALFAGIRFTIAGLAFLVFLKLFLEMNL